MEIFGIILISVAVIIFIHNIILIGQLNEDHSYILKKLNRDPLAGPEGYRDGEIKDIIWIDQSLRKVRWDQAHCSWKLVK